MWNTFCKYRNKDLDRLSFFFYLLFVYDTTDSDDTNVQKCLYLRNAWAFKQPIFTKSYLFSMTCTIYHTNIKWFFWILYEENDVDFFSSKKVFQFE